MLATLEGFDIIVESMFQRLTYPGHSFLSPELFVRCVWSELPNTGTIVAPSGRRSYQSSQNHCSYDEMQLGYLFISPPVA